MAGKEDKPSLEVVERVAILWFVPSADGLTCLDLYTSIKRGDNKSMSGPVNIVSAQRLDSRDIMSGVL